MNKLVEGQFVQIIDIDDENIFLNCYVKDVFDDFITIKSDKGNHRLMIENLNARIEDGNITIPTIDGKPVMVKKEWGEYTFKPNKKKKRGIFKWRKQK